MFVDALPGHQVELVIGQLRARLKRAHQPNAQLVGLFFKQLVALQRTVAPAVSPQKYLI